MTISKPRGALRLATPSNAKHSSRTRSEASPTAGTEDYYERINLYAHKIRGTSDLGEIISILDQALSQTRALHSEDEVSSARKQVASAEHRIEQLKRELELVSKLVREDQLTGALNRRGVDDAMIREAARAERGNTPLCLALIDIDDFKKINDSYGHQVGDIVLVHLVAIIRETIRTNDLIGRYGGEEFLLILPDSRIDEATAVTARLQRELALKPISWGNRQLMVTFSAGAAARRKGETEAALIHRADQALYEAKRVGKNRVIVAP